MFLFRSCIAVLISVLTVFSAASGALASTVMESMKTPTSYERAITIPIVPDPSLTPPPQDGNPVSIPAPPIPFYGTTFYLLFGEVLFVEGNYYVVENTPAGAIRSWITGPALYLSSLSGKRIGAIASRQSLVDGRVRFQVHGAVILTNDLAEQISAGTAQIYVAPRGEISVRLRGRMVTMDQAPIIGNGRTLVGLRAIAEALGAQVSWNSSASTASVRLGDREVLVAVGSNQVLVRQQGKPDITIFNDVAPVIVNGRTMVPARVLSEALGLKVTWTAETQTVDLD